MGKPFPIPIYAMQTNKRLHIQICCIYNKNYTFSIQFCLLRCVYPLSRYTPSNDRRLSASLLSPQCPLCSSSLRSCLFIEQHIRLFSQIKFVSRQTFGSGFDRNISNCKLTRVLFDNFSKIVLLVLFVCWSRISSGVEVIHVGFFPKNLYDSKEFVVFCWSKCGTTTKITRPFSFVQNQQFLPFKILNYLFYRQKIAILLYSTYQKMQLVSFLSNKKKKMENFSSIMWYCSFFTKSCQDLFIVRQTGCILNVDIIACFFFLHSFVVDLV